MKGFTERANLEKSKLEEESGRLRESLIQHTEKCVYVVFERWCSSARVGLWRSLEKAKFFD